MIERVAQIHTAPKVFAPVGRCIYCGDNVSPLSDEHIIPYGLNGNLVLPKASCRCCADKTKAFEQICLREMLGPLRARLGLRTRRKKERPKLFSTPTYFPDGRKSTILIPVNKLPLACIGFAFPAPGITRGEEPSDAWHGVSQVINYFDDEDFKAFLGKEGRRMRLATRVDGFAFGRMLAKIAHSLLAAHIGMDAFSPMLPPMILGHSNYLPHLIGGDAGFPFAARDGREILHDYDFGQCVINGVGYWYVTVRLFAFMGTPRYQVIVGQNRINQPLFSQDCGHG